MFQGCTKPAWQAQALSSTPVPPPPPKKKKKKNSEISLSSESN
jgi:hypothetical protein